MSEIVILEKLLWALSALLKAGLFTLLLYRRNHRVYPILFAYVLITLLQTPVLFATYRIWRFDSPTSSTIGWGSQGLVIAARSLAVMELCRRALSGFRGIWALAWRMLLATAALVLVYVWAVSRPNWQRAILSADRGLELAMAVAIVILFLFVGYYEILVEPVVRYLSIGFFVFSCFSVLNNTILENWFDSYATLWNLLGTLAYLASLLLWIWALRKTQPEARLEPALLPEGAYYALAPEINSRLRALNERLSQFWHLEAKSS